MVSGSPNTKRHKAEPVIPQMPQQVPEVVPENGNAEPVVPQIPQQVPVLLQGKCTSRGSKSRA